MSFSLLKSPCHPLRPNHARWWWHDRRRHLDRTQIEIRRGPMALFGHGVPVWWCPFKGCRLNRGKAEIICSFRVFRISDPQQTTSVARRSPS